MESGTCERLLSQEKALVTDDGFWPGRAKAEFKLAAVNQSSKAGQQGKF